MLNCDPQSGVCALPQDQNPPVTGTSQPSSRPTVRYVGDPMCSWCWGIAPTLHELAAYCQRHGLDFSVTVGGLRPGGGELWNASFKDFLRHEWEGIGKRTGQPFTFSLLDRASFDYDTEPACRAVVAISRLLGERKDASSTVLAFFAAIQQKFYVDGQDPKTEDFYRDLCPATGIAYDAFRAEFLSPAARTATSNAFAQSRRWGVRAFPSLLLDIGGQLAPLATGYIERTALIARLEERLEEHGVRPASDR